MELCFSKRSITFGNPVEIKSVVIAGAVCYPIKDIGALMQKISLLSPLGKDPKYKRIPDETLHDLSIEEICAKVCKDDREKQIIKQILSMMTCDEDVITYRTDVFEDILNNPGIRDEMTKILDRVDFLKSYSSFNKDTDSSGIWQLIHRLNELDEYIDCVEAIYTCLSSAKIKSEGLNTLKEYVRTIYKDNGYEALKKDIKALKMEASEIKSVTLGVNLNDRLEPKEIGITSVNSRFFTESKIFKNLSDFLNTRDNINNGEQWDGSYSFRTADPSIFSEMPLENLRFTFAGLVPAPAESRGEDIIRSLDRAATALLSDTTKKFKNALSRHVTVNINMITDMIPEFMYYVRFVEYAESLKKKGHNMCKPEIIDMDRREALAKGLYNLKLTFKDGDIVGNDFIFNTENRVYILTGANRGGKTTITQAVGIAFVLAQGGVYVPADSFKISPADIVYTHFPADENKTMDLGRLGEESKRFTEIFRNATKYSLLLLNESFSTTSFEEGYYIARGAVRAIAEKGIRTIYNTHMHKLAMDIGDINDEGDGESGISSLIVRTDGGRRSFKVEISTPEGMSYAFDIAKKYGVTYEQLME